MVKVLSFRLLQCFDPFAMLKGPLKHDLVDVYLIMFLGAGHSGNTSAMRVIPIWKMFKISNRFPKCKKKLTKIFCF